jgi:hypothetical protein
MGKALKIPPSLFSLQGIVLLLQQRGGGYVDKKQRGKLHPVCAPHPKHWPIQRENPPVL